MTVQIVGTSQNSWEEATQTAIANARKCIRGLRRAEVIRQDVTLKESESISTYRVRLNIFLSVNDEDTD